MSELFGDPEQLPVAEYRAGCYIDGAVMPEDAFTDVQMRAHAAAARRAALAEAADICDQHASCEGIAERCAAAIRARDEPIIDGWPLWSGLPPAA